MKSVEWYEGYDAGYADAVGPRRAGRIDWGFLAFIVGYVLALATVVFLVGRATT